MKVYYKTNSVVVVVFVFFKFIMPW